MRLNVEVAILEKSVLIGMIQNIVQNYLKGADLKALDDRKLLEAIGQEIERIKELNLVSFYGVQSLVKMEPELLEKLNENKKEK